MPKQEQTLRDVVQEVIEPLSNRIDNLNREIRVLHQAIASSYKPLLTPEEARRILGVGRDALNTLAQAIVPPFRRESIGSGKIPLSNKNGEHFFAISSWITQSGANQTQPDTIAFALRFITEKTKLNPAFR